VAIQLFGKDLDTGSMIGIKELDRNFFEKMFERWKKRKIDRKKCKT